MKMLMISGASSIHTIRWANGLVDTGVQMLLASQHNPVEKLDPRVDFHLLPHYRGLGYFINGPRIAKLIDEYRPDIVNIHYASGYGTLGRWVRDRPVLLNVWGSDVYDFPYKSPFHKQLIIGNLKKADVIASTSHAMAAQVRSLYPDIGNIAITPFGVDTSKFCPSAMTKSSPTLVIGTVKVLADKYGIDTLLKAYSLLNRRLAASSDAPQVELRIIGDGPQRSELEQLAYDLGIQDSIIFLGRIPHKDIPEHLRAFDIYCALSRLDSESFGVAVIEASACGVPVLVSDAGGLPEVVYPEKTGIIVPRENPEAAACAMEKMIRAPELREAMGTEGIRHVRENYEWDICIERMKTLLIDIAQLKEAA